MVPYGTGTVGGYRIYSIVMVDILTGPEFSAWMCMVPTGTNGFALMIFILDLHGNSYSNPEITFSRNARMIKKIATVIQFFLFTLGTVPSYKPTYVTRNLGIDGILGLNPH